jgi:hypothetical protein
MKLKGSLLVRFSTLGFRSKLPQGHRNTGKPTGGLTGLLQVGQVACDCFADEDPSPLMQESASPNSSVSLSCLENHLKHGGSICGSTILIWVPAKSCALVGRTDSFFCRLSIGRQAKELESLVHPLTGHARI